MLPIWKKLASWLGKIHHMDFSDELQWSPSQKQTSWHGWLTMLILFVMNFNGTYHKTNQVDIGNLITLISVMNSNGARHKNRQVDLGNFTMLIFFDELRWLPIIVIRAIFTMLIFCDRLKPLSSSFLMFLSKHSRIFSRVGDIWNIDYQ